jgi:hypothetical protein
VANDMAWLTPDKDAGAKLEICGDLIRIRKKILLLFLFSSYFRQQSFMLQLPTKTTAQPLFSVYTSTILKTRFAN